MCGTALLLGSEGFLGGHVRRALDDGGWSVRAPRFGELDLLAADRRTMTPWLTEVSAVVNCAGLVAGTDEALRAGNVALPHRLIEHAGALCPTATIVHLGSLAEYGAGVGEPLRETDPPKPVSTYGSTKLEGTQVIAQAVREGAARGWVLRVSNPVGQGQPRTTLAGAVAAQIRSGERTIRTGRLDAARDFVSTRDIGRAVVAALTAPAGGSDGCIVNVSSGRATVVRDLVHLIIEEGGATAELVEENRTGSERSADTAIVADPALARTLFGWSAEDSLVDAVHDLLRDS